MKTNTLFIIFGLTINSLNLHSQEINACVSAINTSSHAHIFSELECQENIVITSSSNESVVIDGLIMTSGNVKIIPGNSSVILAFSHHDPSDTFYSNGLIKHGGTHIKPPNVNVTRTSFQDFEDSIKTTISPNPTKGNIIITSAQGIQAIEAYDKTGSLVLSHTYKEKTKEQTLNIAHLKRDTYILKIRLEDGNVVTKRVVKE